MRLSFQTFAVVAVAWAVAGCPGAPEPQAPELPKAPRILSFTADPMQVSGSQLVTLTWETENGKEVRIVDPAIGEISGVDNRASGSLQVVVEKQTLFVLSAINERGVTHTAALSIDSTSTVAEVQFFVSPTELLPGESAVVSWSAPGARSVSLTANGAAVDLEGQRTSGSVVLTPEVNTTLVFTADDVTRQVELQVHPKVLEFFTEPSAAVPGQPLKIVWRTAAASSLQLVEASRGVLRANVSDPQELAEGSHTLQIPSDILDSQVLSFRLDVLGAGGETSAFREVYVAGNPRITSFVVPQYARTGQTFTMSWKTLEASRIEIRSGDTVVFQSSDPSILASGSHTLATPATRADYTLHAYGVRSGAQSRTATVEPVGAASATLSASTTTVSQGGQPVTLSWTVTGGKKLRLRAENGLHLAVLEANVQDDSVTVYPNETTRYLLEVDNGVGELVTKDVTVAVERPVLLENSPAAPLVSGSSVTLTYPGGDATTVIHGYPHKHIATRTASPNFIDISVSGERVPFTNLDDQSFLIEPEGFESFAWGELYDGPIAIATNGWVALNGSANEDRYTAVTNAKLPSTNQRHPRKMIAPFHTDLMLSPDSSVFWDVVGTAPNQILVVQWNDVFHLSAPLETRFTFQAQVHQTGMIRFVYKSMEYGGQAITYVAGTQNRIRSEARQYLGSIVSGTEVTFFGPFTGSLEVDAVRGAPTGWGFVEHNGGLIRASFAMPKVLLPGDVSISEVMFRPLPELATTGQYVELANHTAEDIELHGFTLDLNGQPLLLDRAQGTTLIPAHRRLVLAQSGADSLNGGISSIVDYVYGTSTVLPQSSAAITLLKRASLAEAAYTTGAVPEDGVSLTIDGQTYADEGAKNGDAKQAPCPTPAGSTYGTLGQRGTPGEAGGCMGLVISQITPHFLDISGLPGTQSLYLPTENGRVYREVQLGGTFPFLDGEFSNVFVTAYGILAFRLPNESPVLAGTSPSSLGLSTYGPTASSPNRSIVPYGAPLALSTNNVNTGVYVRAMAAGEDPLVADSHWIIQWHGLKWSGATDDLNYQVKLFKDGSFEFHYGRMFSTSSYYWDGDWAVAWVESENGSRALAYSIQTPFLTENTPHAIRFDRR